MVKLSHGPPVWLAQVPVMALVNGFTADDKVVEVGISPPCGYHLIDLGEVLLVVVVDPDVGIALPATWRWMDSWLWWKYLPSWFGPFLGHW